METLLVVAEHRNQFYGKSRAHGPARFGSFGSPPSGGGFRDINCRTFQSGSGILPNPFCTPPATKRACSSSPKTPSPTEEPKLFKKTAKSSNAIPIPKSEINKFGLLNDGCDFSELWAGPAYSNSPPPSSLPIPKFSLRSKRTVSLDLPTSSASDVNFDHPIAKSAPPSPTRDHGNYNNSRDVFSSAASATKTLRRILNLDISDE